MNQEIIRVTKLIFLSKHLRNNKVYNFFFKKNIRIPKIDFK